MKKVALYLAEGFEEIEALATVDILRRAEVEVDLVSITDKLEIIGSHGIKVMTNLHIDDVKFKKYHMIVLPGGMPGTINLDSSDILKEQIIEFKKKDKYIGAICAAPMILGKMGLLDGKNATCYPGVEENLLGATYRPDIDVVVDGKIITSRGAGTAMKFALKLVELLKGEDVSKKLEKSLLV
jgi:4-methyl-5(b-hydroxyethyl)-thiazole monophosphate biosynthesis